MQAALVLAPACVPTSAGHESTGTVAGAGPSASSSGQDWGVEQTSAPPIDTAFCEGSDKDWLQTEQACGTTPCPRTRCGDGGVRLAATRISVMREGGIAYSDDLRGDNVVFSVHPEGYWPAENTVVQENRCIARLCAPGKIVIEAQFCFSLKWYRGPTVGIGGTYDAFCSPGRLPPGHYTATVDGLAVEFDVPRRYPQLWPSAEREDVHPKFRGWPDAGGAD